MLSLLPQVEARPRAAGYGAQTRLYVGRMAVPFLVDYGATCSAMSEELACLIISGSREDVAKGIYRPEDEVYPIATMERYENADRMLGVAKDAPMAIRYGLVLRCEFAAIGQDRGPIRQILFKILPKGFCDLEGGILGLPVLDCEPYGLGHRLTPVAHVFSALNVALPRTEASRRERYFRERGISHDVPPERVALFHSGGSSEAEGFPQEARGDPLAIADFRELSLAPGESAVVPVVWDRNLPDASFVLLSSSLTPEGATPVPGVWQGPHRLGSVVLANLTEEECYLEIGQVLARGVVDPTDAEEVMASWSQGAAVAVAEFETAEPAGSPLRDAVPPAALARPEAPDELVPELQRLGAAPGWGEVHGEPALVARRAQARRTPGPRYSRQAKRSRSE